MTENATGRYSSLCGGAPPRAAVAAARTCPGIAMLHFFWTPCNLNALDYDRYDLSNTEIVKYGIHHFGRLTPTTFHSFHSFRVTSDPRDVLVGHPPTENPIWDFGTPHGDWVAENALAPDALCHPNTYLMQPWGTNSFAGEADFERRRLLAVRGIIAMGSRLAFEQSLAYDVPGMDELKAKIIRVNMGCEARTLPRKLRFPSRPRRTFLHVSRLTAEKRFDILLGSLAGLGVRLIVGTNMLGPGQYDWHLDGGQCVTFTSIGMFANSNPEINRLFLDECDFFISTSAYEGQNTAVLEACARGIVPLVTPECGLDCDYAISLTFDPGANRDIIERAMTMPDAEYRERSFGVRRHVEEHHSWASIFAAAWQSIEATRLR